MPDYRRAWRPGDTYFFTVNALRRQGNDLLTRHIQVLRDVVRQVRHDHPFLIHGWVGLPDHPHCIIELPPVRLLPIPIRRQAMARYNSARSLSETNHEFQHRVRGRD